MRASRPSPVRASASTWSEAVEPPYPGTSSTGPGRSWATGSTGGSRRTTTATATATATTSASTATPSTSRRRAGESESSTRPVCVGTRHYFVRRRSRVMARDAAYCPDMPTKQSLRPPSEADFTSRLRSAAVTARVGLWLGICFGICFATGLVSHYAQNPDHPVPFPVSPAWGYRVTQGLHVITGSAAVPLLLVKLWTVYPRLFRRPERGTRRLVLDALERVSIAVLVASAIFQLATGTLNSAQWYPWDFSFRATHYALAWVAIGSLAVHIAVKLPIIRRALDLGRRVDRRRPAHRDRARRPDAAGAAADDVPRLGRRGARGRRRRRPVAAQGLGLRGPQRRGAAGGADQQVGRRSPHHRRAGRSDVPPRGGARRPERPAAP